MGGHFHESYIFDTVELFPALDTTSSTNCIESWTISALKMWPIPGYTLSSTCKSPWRNHAVVALRNQSTNGLPRSYGTSLSAPPEQSKNFLPRTFSERTVSRRCRSTSDGADDAAGMGSVPKQMAFGSNFRQASTREGGKSLLPMKDAPLSAWEYVCSLDLLARSEMRSSSNRVSIADMSSQYLHLPQKTDLRWSKHSLM